MGKRTPLFEIHKANNAQMVEFSGWEMPIYYTGILGEHRTVRERVGLFDVSHMGEIELKGKDAVVNLQRLLVSNIEALSIGQVKYTALCYPEGGVVDDVTVYRLAQYKFLLCVNAANTEKDYQWILKNLVGEVEAIDRSAEFAQLALQGPCSLEVLQQLTLIDLRLLKYYWFISGTVKGIQMVISRTGYTGEDGFEIYSEPRYAASIWEMLLTEGKRFGIQPIGLGARDTLRLEMAFPLYGQEIDATKTLLEAGLDRLIDYRKDFFIGRETLFQQRAEGIQRKLIGFRMSAEGIPRSGYEIYKQDEKLGRVTSGTLSPTLGKGIGLGYVPMKEAYVGNEIHVMIRQKMIPAAILETPFYKRSINIDKPGTER